jgi:hypothetical protein
VLIVRRPCARSSTLRRALTKAGFLVIDAHGTFEALAVMTKTSLAVIVILMNSVCVIRTNPATDSDANRPPIPLQTSH